MNRSDYIQVGLLGLLALLIFHPLFYTDYLYTDEAVQLWQYKSGTAFQMFLPQGRYVTEKLFRLLFSKAHTISDVKMIRLVSFAGWLLCIPVWYYVIKQVVEKEALPKALPFFTVLYLICTPSFAIYVSWASCLELFIANTSGLLSGYFLYKHISNNNNGIQLRAKEIGFAILFGVLSLFTYQNGFGCFLLPFLPFFLAKPARLQPFLIAISVYFFIYLVYFLLFKFNLKVNGIVPSERTGLFIAPWGKLRFLVARPLNSAFHFTRLYNENDWSSLIHYGLLLITWISATIYRFKTFSKVHMLRYFGVVFFFFILCYLPSLVVRENYASNRTLLALNMAVFIVVAETLFSVIRHERIKETALVILSILFIGNAAYNFRQLFLNPITTEYRQMRAFVETNYKPSIAAVYFIRPPEDFFVKKYGIVRSWDEFGVPSTFFSWVPEYFVRQVVFEKTGNRQTAEKLLIKSWPEQASFSQEALALTDSILVIDARTVLK